MLLQKMRDRTQTLLFKVIIGAIIFVLLVFGFGAINVFTPGERIAASVNGEDISEQELLNAAERRRQTLLAQLGENADPNLIDVNALRSSTLDQLINNKLIDQTSIDLGVSASEDQINQAILTTPDFQIEGVFDENTYRRLLGQVGLSPLGYKELVTTSLAQNQLRTGLTGSPILLDWELEQGAKVLAQKRDIAFLLLNQEAVAESISVEEEEIAAFYDANEPDFMSAEELELEYVAASLSKLTLDPEFAPTEEELRERYEAAQQDFVAEEQRKGSHILVQVNEDRDVAAATAIIEGARERILAGESFAQLASELSDDPGSKDNGGDLGFAARGVYVGAFEESLFSLATAELSTPVVTEFGVHLIRLEEIQTTEYPSFDERRDGIATEIRRTRAEGRFEELVANMDELAFNEPESLDSLVEELGLERATVKGVTRQAGPAPFTTPALLGAAFSVDILDNGYNSKAIRTESDDVYVLRLVERTDPKLRSLDEVHDDIQTRLLADAAQLRIEELAGSLTGKLEDGEDSSQVADEVGLEWQRLERIDRNNRTADPSIVRAAFDLSPPIEAGRSVGQASLPTNATAVIVVSAVYDGDKSALSEQELASMRSQLMRRNSDLEFNALFETARAQARINR